MKPGLPIYLFGPTGWRSFGSSFGRLPIGVRGQVQREGIVTHIVSETLVDYSHRLII